MFKELNESTITNSTERIHTVGALEKFSNDYWSRVSKIDAATALTVAADVLLPPACLKEIELYDPQQEFAKKHLSKAEYEQYEKEESLLYKLRYFLSGKDAKDEYPIHDRVKHEMAEEAKHDLKEDDRLAGTMFRDDPLSYQKYQKEKAEIEKFKKEHPNEDLDINKYPKHRLVEEVIAARGTGFGYPHGVVVPESERRKHLLDQ